MGFAFAAAVPAALGAVFGLGSFGSAAFLDFSVLPVLAEGVSVALGPGAALALAAALGSVSVGAVFAGTDAFALALVFAAGLVGGSVAAGLTLALDWGFAFPTSESPDLLRSRRGGGGGVALALLLALVLGLLAEAVALASTFGVFAALCEGSGSFSWIRLLSF